MHFRPGTVRYIGAALLASVILVSCGVPGTAGTAQPSPTAISTAVVEAPTITVTIPTPPLPTQNATATPAPDVAALKTAVIAQLPADAFTSTDNDQQIVRVLPLEVAPDRQPLWAVSTSGFAQDPNVQHFVAIYAHSAAQWIEVARMPISDTIILQSDSVVQEQLTPDQIWIGVLGSGAGGPCCYNLLRFDGTTLHKELSFSERNIDEVTAQQGVDQAPELAIVVSPWGGATASPTPPVTTVFYWDGHQMVQR